MKRFLVLLAVIAMMAACAAPIEPVPDDGIGGTGIVVDAIFEATETSHIT